MQASMLTDSYSASRSSAPVLTPSLTQVPGDKGALWDRRAKVISYTVLLTPHSPTHQMVYGGFFGYCATTPQWSPLSASPAVLGFLLLSLSASEAGFFPPLYPSCMHSACAYSPTETVQPPPIPFHHSHLCHTMNMGFFCAIGLYNPAV